jgi:hypothetical protein
MYLLLHCCCCFWFQVIPDDSWRRRWKSPSRDWFLHDFLLCFLLRTRRQRSTVTKLHVRRNFFLPSQKRGYDATILYLSHQR